MKAAIIIVYILSTCFRFALKYLNYRNRNAQVPNNVKDVYDQETYAKQQNYEMEKLKFGIVQGAVNTVVMTIFLASNFFSFLFNYISEFTGNIYWQTFFMFGVILLIDAVIGTAFDAYATFVIEAKYGFNKSTVGTFIGDLFKNAIVGIAIGGGALALFIGLYEAVGNTVFIVFALIIVAFVVAVRFFSVYFLKLFYKFTPLEEGTLKEKLDALAKKTGYPMTRIFIINASKRTTKLNGFFTGFGKTKTIGLFDNLVERMSEEEVVAVLAHEIGHSKRKHLWRRLPLMLGNLAVLLLLAFFVVGQSAVSMAFGFAGTNIGFGIFICFILFTPIMYILRTPSSIISRKHEYESDAFGAKNAGKVHMISSLKKLARENYSNLTPHPFVVLTTYSHPPISDRVAAIMQAKSNKQ